MKRKSEESARLTAYMSGRQNYMKEILIGLPVLNLLSKEIKVAKSKL